MVSVASRSTRGRMNLRQAHTSATTLLSGDAELRETASRDAEALLLHTLQISRATFFAHPERELTAEELGRHRHSVERRLLHEPIQYITGEQEFYGLALHVTPAVLIPRPETEHLVEAVLARLPANGPVRLVDIGTGSGAIAIALAVHLPRATVFALDLSRDALAIAEDNARRHNVRERIHLLHSDLLAALPSRSSEETATGEGLFDAIVSNPPYIAECDRDTLHPQVRDYEPATALFAGASGLDLYRRLIPQAWEWLKPNGLLALEIGAGQRESLAGLLSAWSEVSFVDDLQRIPRVALARRPKRGDRKA